MSSEECSCEGFFCGLLAKKDDYILSILNWIVCLQNLVDHEIRPTDSDKELEDEINRIIERLTKEVGVRIVLLFQDEKEKN